MPTDSGGNGFWEEKQKKLLNATHSLSTTSLHKHVFIVKEMKTTDSQSGDDAEKNDWVHRHRELY